VRWITTWEAGWRGLLKNVERFQLPTSPIFGYNQSMSGGSESHPKWAREELLALLPES
jgi:hypothetical protein